MSRAIALRHLGRMDYHSAWERQRMLAARIATARDTTTGRTNGPSLNTLFLVEHTPAVYTMGTKDCSNDLLSCGGGANVVKTDRGGAVTWHGDGQLVAYLVANLCDLYSRPSVRELVYAIEDTMMGALHSGWGLRAERLSRSEVGTWMPSCTTSQSRTTHNKIGAVGLHLHKWITTHGFALNIDPDLDAFRHIVPCGIVDKGVTSVAAEIGRPVSVSEAVPHVVESFQRKFQVELRVEEGDVALYGDAGEPSALNSDINR